MGKKKLPPKLSKKRKSRKSGLLAESKEQLQLIDLLCNYYGVEDDDNKYLSLSYCLANDYILGFQVLNKRVYRKQWTPHIEAMLMIEIESLIEKGSKYKGVSYAARTLAKRVPWLLFIVEKKTDSLNSGKKKSEALRKRYQNLIKKKDRKINSIKMAQLELRKILGDDWWKEFIKDVVVNRKV